MANATRDPLFWAALDVANHDEPGVGDFCLRCHAPRAWFSGRVVKDGANGIVPGHNGCLLRGDHDDAETTATNDFDGLGCQSCHRIMAAGPHGEAAPRGSGNIWLDGAASVSCGSTSNPCMRGPYTYSGAQPGINPPPHAWSPSNLHRESALCGSCHDVTTPILASGPLRTLMAEDGSDTGIPFPIERTYKEWQQSAFSDRLFADGFSADDPVASSLTADQPCQACHMRNSNDALARACNQNAQGSRTGDLPVHELVGANAWMPRVMGSLYGGPSGLNREADFARTALLAEQFLAEQAAALSISLQSSVGGQVTARVRITNLTGHKLPTGYGEGRRMWVSLQARDAGGKLLWESGAYDASSGTLTADPPLYVYEVQQGVWNAATRRCEISGADGNAVFHFVLNNCVRKDNRIPPAGFRGARDPETRPVGYTYPETTAGSGQLVNFDDAHYTFSLPPTFQGQVVVTATLRHQIASADYIAFLRDEAQRHAFPNENDLCAASRPPLSTGPGSQTRGAFMYELWANHDRSPPSTLATASGSVRVR